MMKNAAPQKWLRQTSFTVAGNHHDGWCLLASAHLPVALGHLELVLIQNIEQVIREIPWRLVNLVNQYHRRSGGLIRQPERTFLNKLGLLYRLSVLCRGIGRMQIGHSIEAI